MLSYKLKHLCSRVIASLSAFGLISISNESGAKTLSGSFTDAQPGDSFKYTKVGTMTMTANMSSVSATCTINGINDSGYTVASNVSFDVTKNGVTVSGCLVTCKDGYYIKDTSGQKSVVYSGDVGTAFNKDITDSYNVGSGFCVPVGTCSKGTSSTIKSVSTTMQENDTTGLAGETFVDYLAQCKWTCADGYSVGGGASTTSTFSSAGYVTGTIIPDQACSARTFKVTFDCGTNAKYGASSYQTGVATATYNSTFTIPTAATCTKAGYKFNGWNGSTN